MKRRIAVFAPADRDLDEIADYLAADDLRVAARFLQTVAQTYENLAAQPGMGKLYECDFVTTRPVRYWPISGFTNYLLFYRVSDEAVEVLRVLHGSRDLLRSLRIDLL